MLKCLGSKASRHLIPLGHDYTTGTMKVLHIQSKPQAHLAVMLYCSDISNRSNRNHSKGAGPDNTWPRLLKEMTPAIRQPFLYIINLSLSTVVVCDKLKPAMVIQVYKKSDHSLPQNYRSISLLSIFHKIHEKVMAKRLKDYPTAITVLYNYQSISLVLGKIIPQS